MLVGPPGDQSATLASAALFFLVVASQYVIKPVRNSVFVERVGADNLPYVYIATALVIGLLISWYSRHLVDRLSPRQLIAGTYVFFASNLLLFSWLLHHDSLATSATFYVWTKLYPVLTVSQFWLMMNSLFEPRQARRAFGPIGAGGILGGIAGASLAGLAAEQVGTANLLIVSAMAILVAAGLALFLQPQAASSAPAAAPTPGAPEQKSGTAASASRLVRESAHLRTLATMLTLGIIVATVVDWQLNKAVELFVAGEDAKTAFFGQLFALVNVAALLVQVFLSHLVLTRLGIGAALLLLPLGLLGGSLAILLYPSLWTAAVADGADGTLRHSLDQSTRELLFLPVPKAIKPRTKPFIDVAAQRIGTGVAGVLILLVTSIADVPFQYLSLLSMAAIAAWIGLVTPVRRAYVESIKRLIHAREVDVDAVVVRSLDAEHRRQLMAALEGDDPNSVLYALELLDLSGEVRAHREQLARLLRHPNQDVRHRTATALARYGDEVLLAAIQPLLEDEDIGTRAEAVRLVCRHCHGDELHSFQMLLTDARVRVRAGAIAGGYGNPDPRFSTLAEKELQRLATESGADGAGNRREAALLTAILPASESTRRVLLRLLEDPEESVRRAAIVSAGRGQHRDAVPLVIRALRSPRTREEARAALVALGDRVVGTVADHLRDPSEPVVVRAQLARVLSELATARAIDHLLESLDEPQVEVRYHVLKSLNRIRRDRPGAIFNAQPVDRAIHIELDHLVALLATRAALSPEPGAVGAALLDRTLDERQDDAVERVTRCLGLLYPQDEIFQAYRAIRTGEPESRAHGVELLDTVLRPAHRQAVVSLFERPPSPLGLRRADLGGKRDHAATPRDGWRSSDPWLWACLTFVATQGPGSAASTEGLSEGDEVMMTIVERADFLRKVDMFSMVRTEYLAKIAAVAKERALVDGEELFRQGSPPEAVYFIVEGELRATRDGRAAWVAGPGDAISSLPVFDRKPTLVTAAAVGGTRVLFVEDEVFNDLMLDNPALPLGIVRFLAGEVRRLLLDRDLASAPVYS